MVKLVDTRDLKSRGSARVRAGSTPAPGTKINHLAVCYVPSRIHKTADETGRNKIAGAPHDDRDRAGSGGALNRRDSALWGRLGFLLQQLFDGRPQLLVSEGFSDVSVATCRQTLFLVAVQGLRGSG